MPRRFGLLVCVVSALGFFAGCKGDANLELKLPKTATTPDFAPDRVSKLEIDGVDYGPETLTYKLMRVAPKSGDTVTVVYTFWPVPYSKTVRTKVVKLVSGRRTLADLNAEDKETPDKVFPIFYPTPPAVVEEMCQMGQVGPDDIVYDIGCGDGRMVIAAVKKFHAKKGVGIDINADLVKQCQEEAKAAGVDDRTTFHNQDALTIEGYAEATVVLLYVGDQFGEKLGPVLRKSLKPGARIVSHRFHLGDWRPDRSLTIKKKNNYDQDEDYTLHLWTVGKQ